MVFYIKADLISVWKQCRCCIMLLYIHIFTYYIEAWGNTRQSYLHPLVKLQKRAIRTTVGARKYDHTLPLFQNIKLLNIKEIYIFCVQILMYKYHHDLLPSVFSGFYVQNNSVHEYHTRQENMLHVPLIRIAPLAKSVRVTGVSLFNHFKYLICLKVSYVTYKYNLKRHIIDNNTLNLVKHHDLICPDVLCITWINAKLLLWRPHHLYIKISVLAQIPLSPVHKEWRWHSIATGGGYTGSIFRFLHEQTMGAPIQ